MSSTQESESKGILPEHFELQKPEFENDVVMSMVKRPLFSFRNKSILVET